MSSAAALCVCVVCAQHRWRPHRRLLMKRYELPRAQVLVNTCVHAHRPTYPAFIAERTNYRKVFEMFEMIEFILRFRISLEFF